MNRLILIAILLSACATEVGSVFHPAPSKRPAPPKSRARYHTFSDVALQRQKAPLPNSAYTACCTPAGACGVQLENWSRTWCINGSSLRFVIVL